MQQKYVAMYDYTTVEPKDSTNQKAIVYLHNNQVGQVQYAFNSDGQMIYERVQTPFGETMGEINAYDMKMPVRFPGQYYDAETGFNQNWFRTYDPARGAYNEPDPIGITRDYGRNPEFEVMERMGLPVYPTEYGLSLNNLYGYVNGNPGLWWDIFGLDAVCEAAGNAVCEAKRTWCRSKECTTAGKNGHIGTECAADCDAECVECEKREKAMCDQRGAEAEAEKEKTPPRVDNCKQRWNPIRGFYKVCT